MAAQYPDIQCNEMIVDNTCMQLVMNPEQFDIIVTTNLFGDIISDLCAGLVGGRLAPGANIGTEAAIFEAVHGPRGHAGKGIANPRRAAAGRGADARPSGAAAAGRAPARSDRRHLEAKDVLTPTWAARATPMSFAQAIASRLWAKASRGTKKRAPSAPLFVASIELLVARLQLAQQAQDLEVQPHQGDQ